MAAHLLHTGAITCLELHGPRGLLATAGDDGCLRLWHLARLLQSGAGQHAAAQLACLGAHGGSVSACCFTSCGRFLASACADGAVRLWSIGAREPLSLLQLAASSVAFAPGDDAALLVAATGPGSAAGPQLLDLRRVPACRDYCQQLATAQADHGSSSSSQDSSACAQQQRRQAALDPAVAVWLPTASPQLPAPPAAAAARLQAAAPGRHAPPGGSTGTRRQVGSLASYGRRRRQRQEEAAAAEEVEEAQQTAAPAASGASSGWLPGHGTPHRQRAPGAGWLSPLSPASPQPPGWDDSHVPEAAVAARYEAAASSSGSSGGGEWDASSRSFVYRQVRL